jgi:hypothetical protein
MKPLISRKEIAQLTGLCVKTLRVKERHFGLDRARVDTGGNRVLFNAKLAIASLQARRLLS